MPKPLVSTLARRIHLTVRRHLHADLVSAGFADLSPVHLYAFQLPGPDGLRPTDLARQMNMTKQATNHMLRDLEQGGYLRLEPRAGDGRGKTIRLTERGEAVMRIMFESSRRLERQWARVLGAEEVERLRASLIALNDRWPS